MNSKNLEMVRKKLLDDAFTEMSKNNSQYGWAAWKNNSYEWWVRRELEWHQKNANLFIKNKSKLHDILRDVIDEIKPTEHNLETWWIYINEDGTRLTQIGTLMLFCFDGGTFEDLFTNL